MNENLSMAGAAMRIDLSTLGSIQNGKPIPDCDAMLVREYFLRNALEPETKEHKFFFEEFQPATIVAEYYAGGFEMRFDDRKEGIDCLLESNRHKFRLEMTLAQDGHSEAIRWEHFKKYGHLSSFDDVKYVGNKQNRKINEQKEYVVTRCDEQDGKILKLVSNCIRNKIEKAKSRPLYNKAVLVVTLNDFKFSAATSRERFHPIFSRASSNFLSIAPFANLLGVCWSGKCIFDRDLAI